jgi:hypothetical protein
VARHWWLTLVIPPILEEELRSITVRSQPGQIIHKTLSQKPLNKKRVVEWLKVKALSSNPSTTKTNNNNNNSENLPNLIKEMPTQVQEASRTPN